ncbi:MAG: Coenzyme PQQ synthesis protein E [Planctomycetes bacterium]|nr:Coenzyme PQQ synthesis protein E [Planctomycetota bacterium]
MRAPPPRLAAGERASVGRRAGTVERRVAGLIASAGARFYLGKPDVRELLETKFPTLGSVGRAVRNEIAFRTGSERSHVLTSVNLELTNHCNLRCTFCPVNTTMRRPKGFMDGALFRRVIDENPFLDFVLAFQWGEPLLHPEFFDLVRYAADRGVRTMITSNGTHLSPENRAKLLACGLERITFSVDGDHETHEAVRGWPLARLREDVLALVRERDAAGAPLRIDVSMVVDGATERALDTYFADWKGIADRVQAIPRIVAERRTTPCRELWRGALIVLWDGRVTVCCVDSEGLLQVGDARTEALADVWNGARMRELRARHARRDFPALCANCGEYEHPQVSKRFR